MDMERKDKNLDVINAEIERELLEKLESGEKEEEEEVTVSGIKFTMDILIVIMMVLFIITNIGVIVWKLL